MLAWGAGQPRAAVRGPAPHLREPYSSQALAMPEASPSEGLLGSSRDASSAIPSSFSTRLRNESGSQGLAAGQPHGAGSGCGAAAAPHPCTAAVREARPPKLAAMVFISICFSAGAPGAPQSNM